jgi:hypothetical protein
MCLLQGVKVRVVAAPIRNAGKGPEHGPLPFDSLKANESC